MSLDLNAERIVREINAAVVRAVDYEARYIEQDARKFAPVRKIFSSALIGKLTRTRRRRQLVGISSSQLNAEAEIRQRLGLGPRMVKVNGKTVTALSVMGEPNPYRQVVRRTLASEMLDRSWYDSLSPQMQRSSRSGKRLKQLKAGDMRKLNERGQLSSTAQKFLTARGAYEYRNAAKRGSISQTDSSGRVSDTGTRRLGGRLRSEITQMPTTVDGTTVTGRVISPTPYAKYVEFGTAHSPAQPYLRPAANIARRRFRKTLQRELDSVKRTHRRSSR